MRILTPWIVVTCMVAASTNFAFAGEAANATCL